MQCGLCRAAVKDADDLKRHVFQEHDAIHVHINHLEVKLDWGTKRDGTHAYVTINLTSPSGDLQPETPVALIMALRTIVDALRAYGVDALATLQISPPSDSEVILRDSERDN